MERASKKDLTGGLNVDFRETFALMRTILALTVKHRMQISKVDVETAYPNRDLEVKVSVEFPKYCGRKGVCFVFISFMRCN